MVVYTIFALVFASGLGGFFIGKYYGEEITRYRLIQWLKRGDTLNNEGLVLAHVQIDAIVSRIRTSEYEKRGSYHMRDCNGNPCECGEAGGHWRPVRSSHD